MKTKKCNYCEEKIEYKEKDITVNKDYGRGIFCNLCGTFIEIQKKVPESTNLSYSRNRSSSRYRYRSSYSRQQKTRRYKTAGIFVAILFLPLLFWVNTTLLSEMTILPNPVSSNFQIISNNTGYDLSNEIPISIHVPKHGIDFNSTDDFYDKINFYIFIDSILAIKLHVDLRPFSYIWIELNPNNFHPNYTTEIGLYPGEGNRNFGFYIDYIGNGSEYFSFVEENKI